MEQLITNKPGIRNWFCYNMKIFRSMGKRSPHLEHGNMDRLWHVDVGRWSLMLNLFAVFKYHSSRHIIQLLIRSS